MEPIWDYEVKYLYGLDENVDNSVIEELLKNDVGDFLAKMDYLSLDGKVSETCYFVNRDFYIETVENEELYGEPMIKRQLKGEKIFWEQEEEHDEEDYYEEVWTVNDKEFIGPHEDQQEGSIQLERSLF